MLNIRPRETEEDGYIEREKKNNRNSIKAKTYSNKLIPVHWHWSEQFEHVYTLWKIKRSKKRRHGALQTFLGVCWVYLLCMRPNQTAPNPSHIKHIPTIDEFGRSRVELIKNSSHWFMIYSSTNYAHFIASLSYYCVVEKKKNKKKKKPVKIVIRMNHNHICIHAHERYRLQSLSFLFHTNNWIFYANSAEFQFANQKETHHHLVGSF